MFNLVCLLSKFLLVTTFNWLSFQLQLKCVLIWHSYRLLAASNRKNELNREYRRHCHLIKTQLLSNLLRQFFKIWIHIPLVLQLVRSCLIWIHFIFAFISCWCRIVPNRIPYRTDENAWCQLKICCHDRFQES